MKTAQEIRAGNVIMVGNDPLVVQKAEYNKSGRNASVVVPTQSLRRDDRLTAYAARR